MKFPASIANGAWLADRIRHYKLVSDRFEPRFLFWLESNGAKFPPLAYEISAWHIALSHVETNARSRMVETRLLLRIADRDPDVDRTLVAEKEFELDDLVRVAIEAHRLSVALRDTAVANLRATTQDVMRDSRSVRLHRVRLNRGGYDASGRYWGLGPPLYRAIDDHTNKIAFARGYSRLEAAKKLGIPNGALLRPASG